MNAEVFTRQNGDLYIDFPDRKNFKSIKFLNVIVIDISKKFPKNFDWEKPNIYWEVRKNLPALSVNILGLQDQYKVFGVGYDFPLLYGSDVTEANIWIQSRKIQSGTYYIDGIVLTVKEEADYVKRREMRIVGKFSYESGIVKNLIY